MLVEQSDKCSDIYLALSGHRTALRVLVVA
jgi:hypothetical protein